MHHQWRNSDKQYKAISDQVLECAELLSKQAYDLVLTNVLGKAAGGLIAALEKSGDFDTLGARDKSLYLRTIDKVMKLQKMYPDKPGSEKIGELDYEDRLVLGYYGRAED